MADKNQDKNQSKNRAEQAEEHDESVLNPEIKNESDLSKKERRLIEKEKLKGMGPKKKLEYIWMYYKPAIFGVIAVIALIFGIKNYYEQSKIKTVLSMTVVNSMANDTETPEQKINPLCIPERKHPVFRKSGFSAPAPPCHKRQHYFNSSYCSTWISSKVLIE